MYSYVSGGPACNVFRIHFQLFFKILQFGSVSAWSHHMNVFETNWTTIEEGVAEGTISEKDNSEEGSSGEDNSEEDSSDEDSSEEDNSEEDSSKENSSEEDNSEEGSSEEYSSEGYSSEGDSPEEESGEDEEDPSDIPSKLSNFLKREDNFQRISAFLKRTLRKRASDIYFTYTHTDRGYRALIDEVRRKITILSEQNANKDSLHEDNLQDFQRFYRDYLTENYDKLSEEISLSALLLPIKIRDNLLKKLLDEAAAYHTKYLHRGLRYIRHQYSFDFILYHIRAVEKFDVFHNPNESTGTTVPLIGIPPLIGNQAAQEQASYAVTQKQDIKENDTDDPETRARRERKLRKLIWNHLTISKDETSASNFTQRLLLILGTSALRARAETQADTKQRNIAPSLRGPSQILPYQRMLFDNQQDQTQHTHLALVEQQLKLVRLRQKISSGVSSTLHPGAHEIMSVKLNSHSESNGSTIYQKNMFHSLPETETSTDDMYSSGKHTNAVSQELQQHRSPDQMLDRIASLEAQIQNLKTAEQNSMREQTLNYIVAKRGSSPTAYLDEPQWTIGPKGEIMLTAYFPIADVKGFLSQKHDIAFVVAKYYSQEDQEEEVQTASRAKQALPRPKHSSEILTFHSRDMIDAAEDFFARRPTFAQDFPKFNFRGPIPAPYLFWYQYRGPDVLQGLSPGHELLMRLVTTWIEDNYGEKYALVDEQLNRGVITQETVPFLFKPGEVIVWENKREVHAAMARSWTSVEKSHHPHHLRYPPIPQTKDQEWLKSFANSEVTIMRWRVDTWRYEYDGKFLRKGQSMEIFCSAASSDTELSVNKLNKYPLKYASEDIKLALEKRGTTFWGCRHRRLVSYEDVRGVYGVS